MDEKRLLLRVGVGLVVLLVVATLMPMFVVIFDEDPNTEDALALMAAPLSLLALAAVIGGIAAAAHNAGKNAAASRRTSEQGIRVGIVWILGLALIVLIVVFGVLASRNDPLPDGLIALASSLVGGLIGVLAPRASGTSDGTTDDGTTDDGTTDDAGAVTDAAAPGP